MESILIIFLTNILYAAVGAVAAVIAMVVAYKVLDELLPNLNPEIELTKGNVSVGLFYGGMFIGIGLAIGQIVSRAFV